MSKQTQIKTKLKQPDEEPIHSKGRLEKRQLRCNRTKLSTTEEKGVLLFCLLLY